MDHYVASTLNELEKMLESFGHEVLFRGQNKHYGDPGVPSVRTSFNRQGCIPSQMLKWSRYSQKVLDAFIQNHRGDFAFQQALLQHYGWRSFFIDCTSNPGVAAWFASHKYSERPALEISEDCDERAVWLRKKMARYDRSPEPNGELYVLDKPTAAEAGLVDLASLTVEASRPRTVAQSAWLIGPLQNTPIPQNCYIAQITAPSDVLREYAAKCGLQDTNTLFPPTAEDPILKTLLGLPWEEIKTENGLKDMPILKRALELPEYHPSWVKIASPSTAFFRGTKILEIQESIDGATNGGILVDIPDIALYGFADPDTPLRFPHINQLLDEHETVVFEADTLIQHPQQGHLTIYQKGIGVRRHEADLFEVGELTVRHPGLEMTGAGFTIGWFYRRQPDGRWLRERNPSECPCDNEIIHSQHLSALHIIEKHLAAPELYKAIP